MMVRREGAVITVGGLDFERNDRLFTVLSCAQAVSHVLGGAARRRSGAAALMRALAGAGLSPTLLPTGGG